MSDFASRFAAGSAIAGDLLDTYDTAKKRKEIAAIAAAQQIGTGGDLIEGTTEAVQQQLDSGAGMGEARKLASAGVSPTQYSFLGKTQDTPLDETAIAGARQQAMAGVMEKFGDPEAAMRYRQQAQQGLRDAQRFKQEGTQFEWATKNQEHIEKSRVREETFNTEREKIMASSPYARVESDNQASQADYQRRLAEYNQAKTAPGMESRDMGPAPIAPTLSKVTPGQEIEHYARLFSNELGAGRVSAESAIKFHQMVNQVKNEGYGQALTLANSGAPIEKVAESFNKNGNIKLDPASVISDKMVKNADGLPSRVIQFKGADGSVHTIDTMAELNAIGAADKVYTRFYQNKADTRADKSLSIQVGSAAISNQLHQVQIDEHKQKLEDAKEYSGIRKELNDAIDSGDTKIVGTARSKLLNFMTSGKAALNNISPEQRKADFYLASGLAKTPAEAARMSHEKVQLSPQDFLVKLMTPNAMGMSTPIEKVEETMNYVYGPNWKDGSGASPGGKPITQAEFDKLPSGAVYTNSKGGQSKKP